MGAQKHEFKFKKQYDEKYGKKVEKETKPETKQETKQETEEEKERKKRAYNSARFFLESADRNYRESNNRISNDNYYEYLRREYLNLDRSAVGAVLSDHPELKHICDVIANY